MEKKEITVNPKMIKKFFLSFLLGFISLYFIEHKSSTKAYPGKLDYNERFVNMDLKISALYLETFFGERVPIPTDNWKNRDVYYKSDFHNYKYSSQRYLKATIIDYKYGILFSLIYFLIFIFFSFFKFKVKK